MGSLQVFGHRFINMAVGQAGNTPGQDANGNQQVTATDMPGSV